jgi:DNA-binding transcriptional LysR family regulator
MLDALGMSQPAVSQHVAALEQAVDVPLVERGTDDYVAIQALVADLGVAVLPLLAVGPTAHRVHARALPHPTPTRRISVALPPDGHRHSAVQTMIDVLRRAGRNRRIDAASAPDFDR